MININGYDCERCGNQVIMHEEVDSGAYAHRCYVCGWEESRVPREDEDGVVLDNEGKPIIDEYSNEGYGVFSVCRHDDMVVSQNQ